MIMVPVAVARSSAAARAPEGVHFCEIHPVYQNGASASTETGLAETKILKTTKVFLICFVTRMRSGVLLYLWYLWRKLKHSIQSFFVEVYDHLAWKLSWIHEAFLVPVSPHVRFDGGEN